MTKEQLDNLKNEVIAAFVAHELGNELIMSDEFYDELLAKVMKEDPSFNIYEFSPSRLSGEEVQHRSGMTDLTKEHVYDIQDYWKAEEGIHKTPKFDGSSVVIYYTNGHLSYIASMGDKEVGVDQTEKFKSFVPKEVDKSISYIRCECLIDASLDDNARGKANGLVNSKYKQDEVDRLCTLMAFCAHGLDGKILPWNEFAKLSQYNRVRDNGIPYFYRAPEVQNLSMIKGFCAYQDAHVHFTFAIDGIVYYEQHFAYKYYFITSEVVTIKEIEWNETEKGLLYPTILIDPVELGTATVSRISSNGVRNLIEQGLGVGAVIEVARSGETIPQVVKVISPAKVELPVCEHCGHQFTEDDILSTGLICTNPDCNGFHDKCVNTLNMWIDNDGKEEVSEWIKSNPEEAFFTLINIARFDFNKRRLADDCNNKFTEFLISGDYDEFNKYVGDAYSWTELSWSEFWFKSKGYFNAIHEMIYNG